jgi:hypothetical protein
MQFNILTHCIPQVTGCDGFFDISIYRLRDIFFVFLFSLYS